MGSFVDQNRVLYVGGITWLKTSSVHYHAQLGLRGKGRAVKVLVACYFWIYRALRPDKWSDPRLLSIVP